MDKKYIIISIVVIVLVGVLVLLHGLRKKEKNVEIKDIVSFHFRYSKGYMMNSDIDYEYNYDEMTDKYIVSVKPYLVDDEDKVIKEVSKEFGEKIKELLVKYDLGKWNGFKKYDKNVLDGDSFSFYVRMVDDQLIEANGYMSWPENYRIVRDEFDKIFTKIYNDEKGIKENE